MVIGWFVFRVPRIDQFEQRLASLLKLQGRQLVLRQETEPAMEIVQGESCRCQLARPAVQRRQILLAAARSISVKQ